MPRRAATLSCGLAGYRCPFHAGITPPDDAMRSIAPGESLVYTFTAQHSGITRPREGAWSVFLPSRAAT